MTASDAGGINAPLQSRRISARSGLNALRRDWAANRRNPRSQFVMALFRLCQVLMGDLGKPRLVSIPVIFFYRFCTEFLLSMELRPKTAVGAGLAIYHGFGLVVNDGAEIGRNVKLRNGTTIGHKSDTGACPIIEDGVAVGANVSIIGGVRIGAGAVIGAGSVVVHDVPPGATAAGNPARILGDSQLPD